LEIISVVAVEARLEIFLSAIGKQGSAHLLQPLHLILLPQQKLGGHILESTAVGLGDANGASLRQEVTKRLRRAQMGRYLDIAIISD
jgi:hypothetical protein